MSRWFLKMSFSLVVLTAVGLLTPPTVFCQTEKLGAVKYTAPKGWTRTAKEHAVVFHEIDQATGHFCFITLYLPSPTTGNPASDFAREWNDHVVQPWSAEANPKTETVPDSGWTVTAGGGPIIFNGNKAFAFLTVVSGFGKTVSVLAVLNDNSYLGPLQAFVAKMDIDEADIATNNAATAKTTPAATPALQYDADGHLLIPPPTRQLTLADLAGNWGESDGINVRYVDRYSGTYAGADSLHYKSKMTFTAEGGYYDDFYAIQNGRMIKEKTAGTIAVRPRAPTPISIRNVRIVPLHERSR